MSPRRSIPAALLFVVLALCPAASRMAGAQIRVHRNLTVDGGLVQTQVNSIIQDRDGFLWIGTNDGVSRFDGVGFTNYQGRDGIPPGPVYDMAQGTDGTIYLGTDVGMAMLRQGRPAAPPAASGLRDIPVRSMAPLPGGGIVFGHPGGLTILHPDGRYEKLSLGTRLPPPPGALLAARDGTLYMGTAGEGLFIHRGGRTRRLDADDGVGDLIRALYETRDGTVYAGTNLGVVRLRDGLVQPPVRPSASRWPRDMVRAIVEGADGTLYLGTDRSGLLVARHGFDGPIETVTEDNGLAWNQVYAIHETTDGAVYVGTDRGVSVYDRGVMESWTADTGLPAVLVWNIAERDGQIWLGTDRGIAVSRPDGRWDALGAEQGLTHEIVRAVHPGPSGKVWAATAGGGAVWWDGSRFHHVGREQGLPAPIVRAVREAPDGTVYFGTGGGLAILHPDGRMEVHSRDSGLPDAVIWALEIAADGGVWIGTMGGLVLLQDGVFRVWTVQDGLPDNRVWSIRRGREGRIYVGTAHGLSIFQDGRFRNFDSRHGLSNDTIYCTVEDGAGRLYLSTNRGINVLDFGGDLERLPRVRTLSRDDGLPSIEGNLGACHRGSDGRLWFGTVAGVSVYDPRREVPVRPPPRVHVTGLRLFGEEVPFDASPEMLPLRFDSQENYFAFSYVGIDLAAPQQVVYRYRLAGLDRGWTETDRRIVQYTNLDAGEYSFEVQARSGGGPWSPPAGLSLHILAPVWQRWWFILAAVLTVGAAGTLLVRYRVQQLLAVERLRAAIAADLHDHIGAGLTEIAILSEIAAHRHGQAGRTDSSTDSEIGEMGKVADIARRLVDQMNDIVWLVNPRRDSLHELFLRLKDSYAELFSHAGVLFRTSNLLLFEHIHLPMEYRQNLYLIFKEALNNSLRHSGCREIELSVALRGRQLEVVLKDDGRGFDSGELEGRGDGLENMRRRASRIGGNLDIDSAPERGTAVAFSGPLASGSAGGTV